MKLAAALLVCALAIAGCGEKKGTYAKFDDEVTAKSWEAWRDSSGSAIYLRPTEGVTTYSTSGGPVTDPPGGTCAGEIPTFRVSGSMLRASVAGSTIATRMRLPTRALALKRYPSRRALWRELESRSLVSGVEVERALGNGMARAKPHWVKEFDRQCLHG